MELNEDFVRHLKLRFENEASFKAVADRTEIVLARLEDLPGEKCYHAVIFGLPLNNFQVPEVEQILGVFRRLLNSQGTLSFFEYIAIRRVKASSAVARAGLDCTALGKHKSHPRRK